MKVVHLITDLSTGGAQMMLYKLMSGTDLSRVQPEVISLTPIGPVGDKIRALGVPVSTLGMNYGRPNPMFVWKLARRLKASKPDVIQSWMYHADLIGGLAAKLAGGIPIAWGIRQSNLSPAVNKRSHLMVVKLCARLSRRIPNRIVCCSESARLSHIEAGYAPEDMVVIPNGFDLAAFRPDPSTRNPVRQELGLPPETPMVGMVGRFDAQKDYPNFIGAAKILHKECPEVHYLLCGSGLEWENETLSGWIDEAGLRDRIHLLGRRDDVPRLTAALDIATISSSGEAFPNVVGEAMACGIPCAVTDAGDAAMIVGDTGKVAPTQDSPALAKAWLELLSLGPDGRAELGRRARRRVEEEFNLPRAVARYESLYKELTTACVD